MHRIVLERKGHEIAKSLSEKYITQWKISALSVLGVSRAMVEPDVELRGRGGLDVLALLAFFPSIISSFSTQNNGGRGGEPGPPGPSPRSTTVKRGTRSVPVSSFLVISAVVDMYLSKRSILELENLSYFSFWSFCLSYSLI